MSFIDICMCRYFLFFKHCCFLYTKENLDDFRFENYENHAH